MDTDRAKALHSISSKLLHVSNRARLDIKLAIYFVCTRVSKGTSTIYDWGKLKRVLQYLKGTLDIPRTLGADSIMKLVMYVDASYAVHQNMRSHTGGCMPFGVGVLMSKSTKQKLNVKISTEA